MNPIRDYDFRELMKAQDPLENGLVVEAVNVGRGDYWKDPIELRLEIEAAFSYLDNRQTCSCYTVNIDLTRKFRFKNISRFKTSVADLWGWWRTKHTSPRGFDPLTTQRGLPFGSILRPPFFAGGPYNFFEDAFGSNNYFLRGKSAPKKHDFWFKTVRKVLETPFLAFFFQKFACGANS